MPGVSLVADAISSARHSLDGHSGLLAIKKYIRCALYSRSRVRSKVNFTFLLGIEKQPTRPKWMITSEKHLKYACSSAGSSGGNDSLQPASSMAAPKPIRFDSARIFAR